MIQRIRDYLHERQIRAVTKRFLAAVKAKDKADARRLNTELDRLRLARSPTQIARMERASFLRMDPAAQRIFLELKGRESRQ